MIFNQHPLSAAFPAMSPEEFQELKDSIENMGVQNPITLLDGMVIDGWHRASACTELGMECPTVELPPDTDPRDFVMAQNKARRHVSKAQLALATTAVYQWKPLGANQHHSRVDIQCPPSQVSASIALPSKTTAELSEISGVHVTTIKQAKLVTTQAAPAVIEAVKRGDIGLPKAAAIAKLPTEQQVAAISKPLPRPVTVVPPPKTADSDLPDDSDDADFAPTEEEIAEAQAHELAEKVKREALEKALLADDQTAHLLAEVQRLALLVEALTRRNNSLLDEKADAIRWAKKFEAHNRRLLKELDELKKGGAQ